MTKPKHDVVRTVLLSPALVSALGTLPRRGIWIVCKRDGASLTYQGLRYMVVALLLRHDVRGTWCSDAGVAAAHGHKDITTTMIYVDVHEDQKQQAIALAFGSTPRKATGGQQLAESGCN